MVKYRFGFQTDSGYVKGRAVGDINETGVMTSFEEFYAIKFNEQNNPIHYTEITLDSYLCEGQSSYLIMSDGNGGTETYEGICDVRPIGHEVHLRCNAEPTSGSFESFVLRGHIFFNEGIESNETSEGFKWKIDQD